MGSHFNFRKILILKKRSVLITCSTCIFFCITAIAFADDQDQLKTKIQEQTLEQIKKQDQARDRIYGSQLMTKQERAEYNAHMRNKKTQQEREAYRFEHHNKMQERARERGLELSDTPPQMGEGKGKRMNTGGGKRQGR